MTKNDSKKYFFVNLDSLNSMDLTTRAKFNVIEEAIYLNLPTEFHFFVMKLDQYSYSHISASCHEWITSHPFEIYNFKSKDKSQFNVKKISSSLYGDAISFFTPVTLLTGDEVGQYFQKLHDTGYYEIYKSLMNKLFNSAKMIEDRHQQFEQELNNRPRKRQRKSIFRSPRL